MHDIFKVLFCVQNFTQFFFFFQIYSELSEGNLKYRSHKNDTFVDSILKYLLGLKYETTLELFKNDRTCKNMCCRSGTKWAHVNCALWIPEVSIGCVEKMEPITKISQIPVS